MRGRFEQRELDQEVEAHLAEKADELMDSGMPEREAREQARREFGNVTLHRQDSREVWQWAWLETLLQDLRYGVRMLRKNPGFTAVGAATLALGISANAAIFSVVSGWMLKKPPVADPDRVVMVVSTHAARAVERGWSSPADFLAWRDTNHVFSSLAAAEVYRQFNLTGAGEPERAHGMRVTVNYFETLGVTAYLGRTFLPGEDQPGRDRVAVLTYGLWQRRFASDPRAIGKTIGLDGEKYTVIGVMPASFRQSEFMAQVWTPLVLTPETGPKARDTRSLVLLARLKPGVKIAQARAAVASLARRAEQNYPASEKGWGANVMTLQEYTIEEDHIRAGLTLLMAAVALVLVIACANIANLLLARGSKRQHEIAIRAALGARRWRLIRQLLVESLLIALLGGAAGLVLAYWGVGVIRGKLAFNEYVAAIAGDVMLDERVLAFTCLISMGAALVFGLAPAVRISAGDPQSTLRHGGRAGDLRRGWGRDLLVGAEIALAMVLVIGAALIIKATAEEVTGDPGFDAARVLTAAVSLTDARYHDPARRTTFAESTIGTLRGMPGVEAAAVASAVPFEAGRQSFSIQGQPLLPPPDRKRARYFAVGPEYFRALGIPLIQGRAFASADRAGARRVAIVNRVFAERFFPGRSAIGRYIAIDHDEPARPVWSEIVGVAANIKGSFGPKEEDAQMYEPYRQAPSSEMQIVVRAAGDPNRLASALRRAVWSADPGQPVARVLTISRIFDEQEGGDYVMDSLLGIFGAMALLLAAIGIYGVVAYSVAQRTHEIGIRMALGARRGDVLRRVVGKGMLLAVVSGALGLLAAAPLPSLFTATLESFRVHSLPIFFCVPLLLLLVVLAAIYVPAARAARVDPMEALRYE